MKKAKKRMLTVAQAAKQLGAAERSIRLWAKQGKLAGAQLIEPPAGVPYWLIPDSALKGFEKRGRGRPPKSKK
ncbi:MAG TPA: hypothetical protein VEZ90_14055 [Blastocatellia bacterium]|nr:hypothetical protein [Blastocatellia bacterium]